MQGPQTIRGHIPKHPSFDGLYILLTSNPIIWKMSVECGILLVLKPSNFLSKENITHAIFFILVQMKQSKEWKFQLLRKTFSFYFKYINYFIWCLTRNFLNLYVEKLYKTRKVNGQTDLKLLILVTRMNLVQRIQKLDLLRTQSLPYRDPQRGWNCMFKLFRFLIFLLNCYPTRKGTLRFYIQ